MVVSTESLTIALMPSLVSLKKCSLPVEFGPLRVLTLLVPSSSPRRISMCLLGSFMIIVLSTIITSRTILLFHAKTTSFMPELVARSSPRWISRWHIIKVSWKSRISTRQHLRLPSVCSSGLSCPQGLCNAVTTFQRFMNWVLRKYIGRFCHIYIDDILVWSDSITQHRHHMRLICQALQEHGVVLSKSKSILVTDKVEFLGFNISYGCIEVTPGEGRQNHWILYSPQPSRSQRVHRPCQLHRTVHSRIIALVHSPLPPHQEECHIPLGK